jgi:hypothetical protein
MIDRPGTVDRPRRRGAVPRAVLVYFVLVFAAMIWPVYPFFAGIDPRVLGLPFSLFYQVLLLVLSFAVLLALYRWDRRRGGVS